MEDKDLSKIEEIPEEQILGIGEQIDNIGQELLANGFRFLKMTSKGVKIPDEDRLRQEQMQSELKGIEQIWMSLKRMGRVGGKDNRKSETEFAKDVMNKIKQKESTLGSIVRHNG